MEVKSVLDPQRHARLLADLENICHVANVPRTFVHQSMTGFCDGQEIDWVVNFRMYRETCAGLLVVARPNPDTRAMAICGALLRNFIDARVMPLNTVLDHLEAHEMPEPTVLIIPNLFVQQLGKALPAWKLQQVYDLLLQRFTANKPTVVCVENLQAMQSAYGQAMYEHLTAHYRISE